MRALLLIPLLFGLACEDQEGPASTPDNLTGGSAGVAGAPGEGGSSNAGSSGSSGQNNGGAAGAAGVAGSAGEGGAGGGAGTGGSDAGMAGDGGAPICGEDPVLPEEKLIGGKDPTGGVFTMEDALAGLPEGPGPLRAILATDQGELTCELRPDLAPIGVANFVGLARGTRPFKDSKTKKWTKRRFYDGLTFHRVIPGFVAQGGDPLGNGFGGPGYSFADELTELTHVEGALAYANSGPNTNGSQFYVTEAAQPSLDGGYTVFGVCTPVSVVTALTSVPRDDTDKPLTPLLIQSIKITRCAP